jgi:hypothetical protein
LVVTLWLERVRPSDLHLMLPQVLLTLDQIRDQAMDPERRLSMLRALRDQVETIQTWSASLPARGAQGSGLPSGVSRPSSLLQRLSRSWCTNLQRLLIDLGQPRFEGSGRYAVYREWTLRQLLRGLHHAVDLGARSGQSPGAGIWRCIYDLFLYLDGRDELEGAVIPGRTRFHPGLEMRRIFLIGGLEGSGESPRVLREIGPQLAEWATSSELRFGDGLPGDTALLRLEVTSDTPPRWNGDELDHPYRGWLLAPPAAYLEALGPAPEWLGGRLEVG